MRKMYLCIDIAYTNIDKELKFKEFCCNSEKPSLDMVMLFRKSYIIIKRG